jgi:hypothetical protein
MIISDSHKFIFFHVPKSAGTSIACKLAPYSNNREQLFPYYELYIDDILNNTEDQYKNQEVIKKMFDLVPEEDMSWYYSKFPEEFSWLNLPHYLYTPHPRISSTAGDNIRCLNYLKKNQEKYQEYCKFCIVRNSWDYAFSVFKNKVVVDNVAKEYNEDNPNHNWDQMIICRTTKESFCNFIANLEKDYTQIYLDFFFDEISKENLLQQHFFCDSNLKNLTDFTLRFDNLQEDLEKISNIIGIDILDKLPQHNTSIPNGQKTMHYSKFYNDEAKQKVANIFASDIERFDFIFGE